MRNDGNQIKELFMKILFMITALASVVSVVMICIFLFMKGIPAIGKIGVGEFLLGREWLPSQGTFGIFPMIIGSIYVTAGAIVLGVPVGIFSAVYMVRFAGKRVYRILKPAVDLMAGIPSIVYGFFGLMVIVPAFQPMGGGKSLLTASILLGIMILPTIIGVVESSLRAVPDHYYEGALALGATKERSVFSVVLPAAKSGVLAGVALGIGRVIGETMAVVMVAGNQALIPESLLSGVRTMTANIVLEMGYASGLHQEALIATAVVLFVFILLINLSFSLLKRRID